MGKIAVEFVTRNNNKELCLSSIFHQSSHDYYQLCCFCKWNHRLGLYCWKALLAISVLTVVFSLHTHDNWLKLQTSDGKKTKSGGLKYNIYAVTLGSYLHCVNIFFFFLETAPGFVKWTEKNRNSHGNTLISESCCPYKDLYRSIS